MSMIGKRNAKLFDMWSITHLAWGIAGGWVMPPFIALSLLVLWEPFEVLLLSPFLWRRYKIVFGHEALQNSLSDIIFDTIGVALGVWSLTAVVVPPFHFL
jgi:hypothetical protein